MALDGYHPPVCLRLEMFARLDRVRTRPDRLRQNRGQLRLINRDHRRERRAELVPGLLERNDLLLSLNGAISYTLKRVFRHLPFLDAPLTVDLNLAQDIAGAH